MGNIGTHRAHPLQRNIHVTITLPDTSSGYAWVASPAWMYDHWRWLWFLISGATLMTIGYVVKRIDGRSFATGLLIVLGTGPLLVGAVCGIAASSFWMRPSPGTINQTWMFVEDANHEFRVPIGHLPTNRYEDPPRDSVSDRNKINSDLTNGLVLNKDDRITVDGKPATVVGFRREMLRVTLDALPDAPITVDATWRIEKIED